MVIAHTRFSRTVLRSSGGTNVGSLLEYLPMKEDMHEDACALSTATIAVKKVDEFISALASLTESLLRLGTGLYGLYDLYHLILSLTT